MIGLKEKKHRNYPLQLKKKIALEIISGLKTATESSRDYDVPRESARRWAIKFSSEVLKKETKEVVPLLPMKEQKEKKDVDFEKQVHILEEENLKLREKLLESNLKAEALSTLIDLAEENYGLSLRKNSGAKQSKD
jgi:transposase-like protein